MCSSKKLAEKMPNISRRTFGSAQVKGVLLVVLAQKYTAGVANAGKNCHGCSVLVGEWYFSVLLLDCAYSLDL